MWGLHVLLGLVELCMHQLQAMLLTRDKTNHDVPRATCPALHTCAALPCLPCAACHAPLPRASPSLPRPAAETAITIDDVVVVVNSGRLKEKSFDPYTNVSTLMVGCSLLTVFTVFLL